MAKDPRSVKRNLEARRLKTQPAHVKEKWPVLGMVVLSHTLFDPPANRCGPLANCIDPLAKHFDSTFERFCSTFEPVRFKFQPFRGMADCGIVTLSRCVWMHRC
jgi:hypothetical protein